MASSKTAPSTDGVRQFSFGAILFGVALFLTSFLPALSAGSERWTSEKALEYQKASEQIQRLTHEVAKQSPDATSRESSDQFQHAIDHFESLRGELEDARGRKGTLATVLRILGGTLAVVGLIGATSTVRRTKREHGVHLRRTEPIDSTGKNAR
jgi:hypothetical protein